MHEWIQDRAEEVRKQLGLKSFATRSSADQLLEFSLDRGVQVRIDSQIDCLAEIRRSRGQWFMKLLASLEPSLQADLLIHEIAHTFTLSGMATVCAEEFSWWWRARDEYYAQIWCAHFRIPTEPLLRLVDQRASWEDLLFETEAPEGLLALKLHLLKVHPLGQPRPPALLALAHRLPPMASEVFRTRLVKERGWQYRLELIKPSTGERWAVYRAQHRERYEHRVQELDWDLVGWTEERFWQRWHDRLEPLLPPGQRPVYSNPKEQKVVPSTALSLVDPRGEWDGEI